MIEHVTDSGTITIAPVTLEDVDDYVHLHIELLCVTYAHIFTPRFAETRRREFQLRKDSLLADLETTDAPYRTHYLARSHRRTPVAVMAAGPGTMPWEQDLLEQGWFPPETTWNLDHLYLVPGVHGTGLAKTMLELGTPHHHAYLWMYPANARALAFYKRHGFRHDGLTVTSAEETTYGDAPMIRMVR